MEKYFHVDHGSRTCVTAYPNLVTKSQRDAKSHDFSKHNFHWKRSAVSKISWPVCGCFDLNSMPKTSLEFGFFCDVNQNLKARHLLSGPLRKQEFTSTGWKRHGLWSVIGGFRSVLCVSVFQGSLPLNLRVRAFSLYSSHVILPVYWNMTSLDSQGEVVPYRASKSRRNTHMQRWKRIYAFPPTVYFLQLLLVIVTFIWQARIRCYGNVLIDVEEKHKILRRFWQHR